jgi:hypothetical protein
MVSLGSATKETTILLNVFTGFLTLRKPSDSSKPFSPGDAIGDETRREAGHQEYDTKAR